MHSAQYTISLAPVYFYLLIFRNKITMKYRVKRLLDFNHTMFQHPNFYRCLFTTTNYPSYSPIALPPLLPLTPICLYGRHNLFLYLYFIFYFLFSLHSFLFFLFLTFFFPLFFLIASWFSTLKRYCTYHFTSF